MSEGLRLLTVHAHPDDESSKGAGTVARYVDEGATAVLVCCTGGEEGDILNAEMDRPEVRERMPAVRRQELARATEIIGYHRVHWLGYRDSGMPESEANLHPESFVQAPFDEAVDRLVAIIERERPHVVVTYPDDQQYRHPDHLLVHDVTIAAYERLSSNGAPPLKLYYTAWSRARLEALHAKFHEHGLESPYDEAWFEGESKDHRITTRIDVAGWYDRRCDALLAHRTQVDPNSPFWFGLPREIARNAYPYDDYILARSKLDVALPEDDLFAGLRDRVAR